MDEGRDSQVAGNFWTVLCMRNNETSCSCFWLLSPSFHEGSMGITITIPKFKVSINLISTLILLSNGCFYDNCRNSRALIG